LEGLVLDALMVVLALFLVALNGLFVAAEFAFVKIRATQVDRLVQQGRATARLVKDATRRLDAYLSVCQLGITISSLGLGWIGEPAFAHILEPLLEPLGVPEGSVHVIAFAAAFGTITFLHVVFGELAPKSVAIARAEETALFIAPFMKLFYYLFLPGIYLFNGTANAVVRLFGVPPPSETEESHSEEELRIIIEQSALRGVLDTDEKDMLEAVFELEEIRAREVMVPRPDVVAVPDGMPLGELFSVTAQGGHTRYPVHEDDSLDRIVGAVHLRDVMSTVAAEGLEAPITARDLARDVLVVPENRPIDVILKDLQKQEIQVAIVIDEWGSFEGLITIEDIIEELVGEIRDEFDEEEEPAIRERPDGSWLVDGILAADELKERLGLRELPRQEEADYQTVGGMVMDTLGRVPSTGDRFEWEGRSFEVVDMDGRRVDKVLVASASETDALGRDSGE
jgi:CBS domain containing-hemolysin-like protein